MLVPKAAKQGDRLPGDHTHPSMVSMKQVHEVLVAPTCSYQHFHKMIQSSRYCTQTLKGEDMQVMKRLEACPHAATSLVVGSCQSMVTVMKACKVPSERVKGMTAISMSTLSMECLPIPSHVTSQTPLGIQASPQLQVVGSFPTTLPPYQLPTDLKKSYGLRATKPAHYLALPLQLQESMFKAWCTNPIQLDRPGRMMATSTVQHHLANISLFLGHCHWHMGVANPSFQEYLEPLKVSE